MRERSEAPPNPVPPNPVPPKPRFESPINWWTLSPIDRIETLSVLSVWVPELVSRYELADAVVPPCWFQHEPMVQEMLALYQYRNQQQVLPAAPPGAMLDFHAQFQLFLSRMRFWVGQSGCNVAEHFEHALQHWVVPGQATQAKWAVRIEDHFSAVLAAQLDDNADAALEEGAE